MRKTFAALMLALSMQFAHAQEANTCDPVDKFLQEFKQMADNNGIRYATTNLTKEQVIKVIVDAAHRMDKKIPDDYFDGLIGGILIQGPGMISIIALIKNGQVCGLASVDNDVVKNSLGISGLGKDA